MKTIDIRVGGHQTLVMQMLVIRQRFGSIRKILPSNQSMSTARQARSKSVAPSEPSSPDRPLFPTSARATSLRRRRLLAGPSTSTYRPDVRPEVRSCQVWTIAWKWRNFALRLYTVFRALQYKRMYVIYMNLAKMFLHNQIIGEGENRKEVDVMKQNSLNAKMIQSRREAKAPRISMDPIFRVIWNAKERCKEVATYQMDKPGKQPPRLDPAICAHPESSLEAKGNSSKTEQGKWFICVMCQTRWIRRSLKQPAGTPKDDNRLDFGCHIGQTYDFVFTNHFSYCRWAVETFDIDPSSDSHKSLTKLVLYTKHRMIEEGEETQPAASSSQETKPKNQHKKRTIEPEIADMDTEVLDPVKVLVPGGEDSDSFTDWTQAN